MWEKVLLFIAFWLNAADVGQCVLTGFEQTDDITLDKNFNCNWLGGIDSQLVCSCLTGNEVFYIKERSIPPYSVNTINLTNCHGITFGPNAIYGMRSLRIIELTNIKSLTFEENSLSWIGYVRHGEYIPDFDPSLPSLKIHVAHSTVRIAGNAIKGRINFIHLKNVTIESIAPFGVSSLQQTSEILLDAVEFKEVLPQSFKKFTTNKLIIKNSVFYTIPSRAFYDITVRHQFVLNNATIDTIKPAGFIINQPSIFEVSDCTIGNLNGDAFKVVTRGGVLIRNNYINHTSMGAFRGISLNREEVPGLETLTYDRDVFQTLSKESLVVNQSSFIAKYNKLKINAKCDCKVLERYFKSGEDTQQITCLVGDDWMTVDDFRTASCSMINRKTGMIIVIVASCLTLAVIILVGMVCYFRKLYRCGSYGEGSNGKQGKMSMIVPDGRTYRETELHVIVERADLLTTDL